MQYKNTTIVFIVTILFCCLAFSADDKINIPKSGKRSAYEREILWRFSSYAARELQYWSAGNMTGDQVDAASPPLTVKPDFIRNFFSSIRSSDVPSSEDSLMQQNLIYLCNPLQSQPVGTVASGFNLINPETSKLYKGMLGLADFPILHPFKVEVNDYPVLLAANLVRPFTFFPQEVGLRTENNIDEVKIIIMSLPWSKPVLYRPHDMLTKKKKLSVTIADCDFGDARFKGSSYSQMYSKFEFFTDFNPAKNQLEAFPDDAEIVFYDKNNNKINPNEIDNGSFWIIHKDKKTTVATFFWIINNPALQGLLQKLVMYPDIPWYVLLNWLKDEDRWGNPGKRLYKIFGLEKEHSRNKKRQVSVNND
ncbi:MAG: hypothetical protein OXC48_00405 [Endozoicomonadaceae bacterium]|nr:hypothetical protein [Endozoicomonadaceae bacterium]